MGDRRPGKTRLITTLVVVILLAGTLLATVCLWLLIDRERHGL